MEQADISFSKSLPVSTKDELLRFSRLVLLARLSGGCLPEPPERLENCPVARQRVGLFVTLRKRGNLRGCIGTIETEQPLIESIVRVTQEAAFQDYRFPPVVRSEFDEIRIEHSLLSRPQPITSVDQIRLGVHGVILRSGSRSAVFLPEVPTQQGWTLEQMLTALSQKAGLSPWAWQDPAATFTVFTTIHYGED